MPQHGFDDLLDDVPETRLARVRNGLERLTPRELEVLKRAISGETASDSASRLGISVRTSSSTASRCSPSSRSRTSPRPSA